MMPCTGPEVATRLKPQQRLGGDSECTPSVQPEALIPYAPEGEWEAEEIDKREPSDTLGEYQQDGCGDSEVG